MDPEKIEPENYFTIEKEKLNKGQHHLTIKDLFRLSLRVFKTNPTRTILTIMGISLGVGTVLFLISLGYGLQYILIGKLAATEDSLVTLDTYYPSESSLNITYDDIEKISKLDGVAEMNPVAEFTGEITGDDYSGFVIVKIVDDSYFRLSGTSLDIGSVFKESEKKIVISGTALSLISMDANESAINKNIKLRVFYPNGNENNLETQIIEIPENISISGIIKEEYQQPFILIPSSLINQKPPYYQRVLVKAEDVNTVEPLRDKLVDMGFLISARIDLVNQTKRIMSIITIILGVFGITALVVSAIGMFNTMIIGFLERIFEVGIMKAVGATSRDIRNLFLTESLLIGILGGGIGILIGVGAGDIFNLGLNILAKSLGGKSIDLFIRPWWFLALIMGVSSLIGIFSGFWPARKASMLSPREAFTKK
ncbi:ABC transporter permease [Patescibacteria group bacterium]|nr:ABC transporter permease [Patescibacteria group bacterium]